MEQKRFTRIAILNRGEAAIRFMRAARTWTGIHSEPLETVAFYTTPDRDALFVRMATHAVNLGEAMVPGPDGKLQSAYLDIERVIHLTKEAGATAVWPGWGFLAESAEFAEACEKNGITFIGPSAKAIRLLGDKVRAKALAETHGVPVTAWSRGAVPDLGEAARVAGEIGYPLLVKASAGGGGRGIRVVRQAEALEEAFESARAEALSAFGNAEVLMEQMVGTARHVEVQLIGDHHGQVWALGTRDCSVQRRHQKLIEEAPAPQLPPGVEEAMGKAAVAIARGSDYVGAGTAEFLFEPDTERFYFLEMNTRLQVEHTITEEIFGVDLAVAQILVARGEKLPSEHPPELRGAAVELRLNAENPDEGFAPSAGQIVRFEVPQGPGIRVDSGYAAGDEVPTEFDSNIAKVIAWGQNRTEAWARLQAVLRDTVVAITGGPTNRSLLVELVEHPKLRAGPVTTQWLDGYLGSRESTEERSGLGVAVAAAAVGDHLRSRRGAIFNFLSDAQRGLPRRASSSGVTSWRYLVGKQTIEVAVATLAPGLYRVSSGEGALELRAVNTGIRTMVLEEPNGVRHSVIRIATAAAVHVDVNGVARTLTRVSDGAVSAPIPAAVTRVHVKPGDEVRLGDRLVTLEVMKMESAVESPQSGIVKVVHVDGASRVAAGDPLVTIEEAGEEADRAGSEMACPFPSRASALSSLEFVRMVLLGYDIDAKDFERAIEGLQTPEQVIPRGELVDILELVLVQESLFARGSFDEARNSAGEASGDQLLRFIRHPQGYEELLSALFKERIEKLLQYHGVLDRKRSFELEAALLRLFEGDLEGSRLNRLLFTLVDAIFATEGQPETPAESHRARRLLEGFAHYAAKKNRRLAQLVWQVIFRFYDEPILLLEAEKEGVEAEKLLEALVSEPGNPEREAAVLDMSLAALLGTVGELAGRSREHAVVLLNVFMKHIYQVEGREPEQGDGNGFLMLESPGGAGVVGPVTGVLLRPNASLSEITGACKLKHEVDIYIAQPPSEEVVAQLVAGLGEVSRLTLLWAGLESRVQALTFVKGPEGLVERELIRNFHPARPIVKDIERWESFDLERLDAPADILLARAVARDGSGDDRLIVLAEVDHFNPRRLGGEGNKVTLPAFERVYLHAVYAISEALTRHGHRLGHSETGRGNRNRLVWNRISLFYRPIVQLSQGEIEHIVARLIPWAPGLGLEKVTVQARFVLPGREERAPKALCVEWSEPTRSASVLNFLEPIKTPHRVLSAYEQRVVEARRQGKFYPYELISALTTRSEGTGFADGEFEEFDLIEGELVSVKTRPPGENQANLVVGVISNVHPRFESGLKRVLIIGDPTRSMGALAEPECERIIEALNYAEAASLPVEWVPVSSGAKIAFDSGTENLDWTARVLRRIILFTQAGGVINMIVDGICVGAQSYWNAEATMLNHCRGALIMTGQGCMLLTGRKALEYSGSVSARTNQGVGGLEEIMWPNGEAQYAAGDMKEAYELLFSHYALTYIEAGCRYVASFPTSDAVERRIDQSPYQGEEGFATIGEIFSDQSNPGRKRPFDIRQVMTAVLDQDVSPIERWRGMEGGESAVVFQGQLGGCPLTCIGIESKPVPRRGQLAIDGPEAWTSGTLFPHSSRKVARAINASSGVCPVLVLANLSGFDGSPESMRERQLEFGAQIGRAVVNFNGPVLFCVISRYHGGAYVVFSQTLNPSIESFALEGSYASVIGGGPAAAVVFPRLVKERIRNDARAKEALAVLRSKGEPSVEDQARYDGIFRQVETECQAAVAAEFDGIHSVQRALEAGSLSEIISPLNVRAELSVALHKAVERYRSELG